MQRLIGILANQQGLALAALRAVMGVIIGYAGNLKVFRGDLGVAQFTDLGLPLPQVLGPAISLLELAGGLALFLGLFTRVLGLLFAVEFLVATAVVTAGAGLLGARLELLLCIGGLLLAARGGGAFGLDRPGAPWEP